MKNLFFSLFLDNFTNIEKFFNAGGIVLYAIALVAFIMWILLIERTFYLLFSYKKIKTINLNSFQKSHFNKKIEKDYYKKMLLSQINLKLKKYTYILKALISICPMLGLLGTVLGMIEVFDVVSIIGTGNAKALADGVSKATIPTMSGMVVALSGIFFLFWYQRKILHEELKLMEQFEAL